MILRTTPAMYIVRDIDGISFVMCIYRLCEYNDGNWYYWQFQ